MERLTPIFATITLTIVLGACTQAPPSSAAAPPFYVPATLIVQKADSRPAAAPSMLAMQVLPAADWQQFFVPREEKFVYGATSLSEVSAYSVLVYDAQRISGPYDNGYRYTWETRQGIEFP